MTNTTLTAAQLLAENGYVVDTSTVTFTAQNILSEQNYTTTQCPLTTMELLCDNAITYVNLQANTTIALMSGTAGSKTASMTGTQAAVVKQLCALMLRARQDKGPNAGIRDISVTATISDPQYALYSETIKLGLVKLQALSAASVEQQIDNAVNYVALHTELTTLPHMAQPTYYMGYHSGKTPTTVDLQSDIPVLTSFYMEIRMKTNTLDSIEDYLTTENTTSIIVTGNTMDYVGFTVYSDAVKLYFSNSFDASYEPAVNVSIAGTERIRLEVFDGDYVVLYVDDVVVFSESIYFFRRSTLDSVQFYVSGALSAYVASSGKVVTLDSQVMGVVKLLASAYLRSALNGKAVESTTLEMVTASCLKLKVKAASGLSFRVGTGS